MLRSVTQRLYDQTIREHLPRKIKVYNGVALPIGRLLDRNVVDPNYKEGTINPLRTYTRPDDRITVIGGGFGVSAVVAAHHGKQVVVYEGGLDLVEQIQETARLNRVEDAIEVRPAIVSEGTDIYGARISDHIVAPEKLEPCDVLEMDCEGAEESILSQLDITPRVIIVEIHPSFGVESSTIREILNDRSYDVTDRFELDNGNITIAGVHP